MSLTLRQVCFVTSNLEKALDDFKSVFGVNACYVDPDVEIFGVRNTLLSIGTNFFEIISPVKDETPAGRYLKRRGGDSGYMIITQADNADIQRDCRSRAEKMGIRIAWEGVLKTARFMQLHPADTGGGFFEIDSDEKNEPGGNWVPAGGTQWKNFIKTDVVKSFSAVELQSPDPETLAGRWSDIAGTPLRRGGDGNPEIPLNNASIRFVGESSGQGEYIRGIDINAADPGYVLKQAEERDLRTGDRRVTICGVHFNIVK